MSKYFELIVNWFLNLLVGNVIEMEIKREKVQMKPPIECALNFKTKELFFTTKGFPDQHVVYEQA